MKYWNTLTNLETEIIRLSEFRNLFELILHAVENGAEVEQVNSGLYTMSGMLEDINENLSENFYGLWDTVRNDSSDEDTTESDARWTRIVNDLQKVSTN
jgi:hypothetical protein